MPSVHFALAIPKCQYETKIQSSCPPFNFWHNGLSFSLKINYRFKVIQLIDFLTGSLIAMSVQFQLEQRLHSLWNRSCQELEYDLRHHLSRQLHPIHYRPLLLITNPRCVEPIGQLVLWPCWLVTDDTCREVFRGARTLTLGDEPFTGAVEYRFLHNLHYQ